MSGVSCSEPTYEGLKLRYGDTGTWVPGEFGAYLRGIETCGTIHGR